MKNRWVRILLVILIAASMGAGTVYAADQEVLAKVRGKTVTRADLETIIGFYPENQQAYIRNSPEGRDAVLKNLLTIMVISDVARKKGYEQRKQIKKKLRIIKDEFLTKTYIEKEILDKVKLSNEEVEAYYKSHPAVFEKPEGIRARHILIAVRQGASDQDRKAAKKKAEDLLERIRKGEDFAKLAGEYSDDPGSKEKGGDLGFFTRNTMIPEFDKAAFALEAGGVSGPVETAFGYHIIKVEEKKKAFLPAYETIKEEVKEKALLEAKQERVEGFIDSAFKKAGVKLYTEPSKKNK